MIADAAKTTSSAHAVAAAANAAVVVAAVAVPPNCSAQTDSVWHPQRDWCYCLHCPPLCCPFHCSLGLRHQTQTIRPFHCCPTQMAETAAHSEAETERVAHLRAHSVAAIVHSDCAW